MSICWLFVLSLSGQSQSNDWHFSARTYEKAPKVGLALSGGAAHGLAHIGVIQYLEDHDIGIDYITGTSMGAIIGALYAMGYTGDQLGELAGSIDWDAILNGQVRYQEVAPVEKYYHDKYPLTFAINDRRILLPQGIINTNRLELQLARLFSPALHLEDFDDFPRPFHCFGVDIETGEVIEMKRGRLPEALRASMAIPSVFSPSQYEGRWLVDGGLMKNFPVMENKAMGADIVIGSYVGREKAEMSELENLLDILSEATFMMSLADSKIQKEYAEILICPDVKDMALFGFEDYESLIRLGYMAAERHFDDITLLHQLQVLYYADGSFVEPISIPEYLFIDSIQIDNLPDADKELAQNKFGYGPRTHLTYDMIEEGIAKISATLNFESVTYQLKKVAEKNILHILIKPREYRQLGVNVNHFSDTNSSLIVSGQWRNFLMRLSNMRATLRLSENPGAMAEYYVRSGLSDKRWVAGLRVSAEKYQKGFFSLGRQRKIGFLWEGHIEPYLVYEFDNISSLRGSIDLRRFDFTNELQAADDLRSMINSSARASIQWRMDMRDQRVLPTKGSLVDVNLGYGFSARDRPTWTRVEAADMISFPPSRNYFDIELLVSQVIPVSSVVRWELTGDVFYRSAPSLLDGYDVGGTSLINHRNLPFIGYRIAELHTDRHIYFRSAVRIAIYEYFSASIVANAILARNMALSYHDPGRNPEFSAFGAGIELGVSTPIGPLLFDVGYNSESEDVVGELSVGWRHFF